jgi:hypothetical protein
MNWDTWLDDYFARYRRTIFVPEVRAKLTGSTSLQSLCAAASAS